MPSTIAPIATKVVVKLSWIYEKTTSAMNAINGSKFWNPDGIDSSLPMCPLILFVV